MIKETTIREIQNRIDIIDVVGEFVQLKKKGTNYSGLCPFHNEKTPSFSVSQSKGIYKCFGCGKSGNAITFVMEYQKMSYVEAMRWMANRYNIPIEEDTYDPNIQVQKNIEESLFIINESIKDFYKLQLPNSLGLAYLQERGFNADIIEKFQLGFANAQHSLTEYLLQKQFSADIILKSGVATERNGKLVDNYRDRIIFPIQNVTGKVLGFGARILKQNAEKNLPKYINTAENEIYLKSRIVYGINLARQNIIKADECILVEGYTDVISLYNAGIQNVVASAGTSLTVDQILLIKKSTKNIVIIYDGDEAGMKATARGVKLALHEAMNVSLLLIPDKEDPDGYIKKYGAEAFIDLLKIKKTDYIFFEISLRLESCENDATKKNQLINDIAETIAEIDRIEDFAKQEFYIKRSAKLLNVNEDKLTSLVNSYTKKKYEKEANIKNKNNTQSQQIPLTETPTKNLIPNEYKFEIHVIRILLDYGNLMYDATQNISVAEHILTLFDYGNEIHNVEYKNIMIKYNDLLQQNKKPTIQDFIYSENEQIRNIANECLALVAKYNTPTSNLSNDTPHKTKTEKEKEEEILYLKDIASVEAILQYHRLKKYINDITQQIKDSNNNDEKIKLIHIHNEIHEHMKMLANEIRLPK